MPDLLDRVVDRYRAVHPPAHRTPDMLDRVVQGYAERRARASAMESEQPPPAGAHILAPGESDPSTELRGPIPPFHPHLFRGQVEAPGVEQLGDIVYPGLGKTLRGIKETIVGPKRTTGAVRALAGAGEMMQPMVGVAAIEAPIEMAASMGASHVLSKAAGGTVKWAGGSDEQRQLAEEAAQWLLPGALATARYRGVKITTSEGVTRVEIPGKAVVEFGRVEGGGKGVAVKVGDTVIGYGVPEAAGEALAHQGTETPTARTSTQPAPESATTRGIRKRDRYVKGRETGEQAELPSKPSQPEITGRPERSQIERTGPERRQLKAGTYPMPPVPERERRALPAPPRRHELPAASALEALVGAGAAETPASVKETPESLKEPWQMTRAEFIRSRGADAPVESDEFARHHLAQVDHGAAGLSVEGDKIVYRDESGKPVGVTTLRTAGGEKVVDNTAVDPDHRRQGIATLLYRKAAELGYQSGWVENQASAAAKHKIAVQDAIEAGKPVPEEVRAEYPSVKKSLEISTPSATISPAMETSTPAAADAATARPEPHQETLREFQARGGLRANPPEMEAAAEHVRTLNTEHEALRKQIGERTRIDVTYDPPHVFAKALKSPKVGKELRATYNTKHEELRIARRKFEREWGHQAIHRREVEKAIAEGKDVPAEVLADYPELQKPSAPAPADPAAGTREPWQYTKSELEAKIADETRRASELAAAKKVGYFDSGVVWRQAHQDRLDIANGYVKNADKARANHRKVVAEALAEGKPVPPEVLEDYPDLKPSSHKFATTEEIDNFLRTPRATKEVYRDDIVARARELKAAAESVAGSKHHPAARDFLAYYGHMSDTERRQVGDWGKPTPDLPRQLTLPDGRRIDVLGTGPSTFWRDPTVTSGFGSGFHLASPDMRATIERAQKGEPEPPGKPQHVIAETHAKFPEKEQTIRFFLDEQSRAGRPAVAIGESLFTIGAEYNLARRTDGSYRLENKNIALTRDGMERVISQQTYILNPDKEDPYTSYNPEAKQFADKFMAERRAREEEAQRKRDEESRQQQEEYRRSQEYRHELLQDFSRAKFKQQSTTITLGDGKTKVDVKGPTIAGLIVHRAISSHTGRASRGAEYDVTHIASGLRLNSNSFPSQTDAKVAAYRFSKVGDWRRPASDFDKDPEFRDAAGALSAAISQHGAYVTPEEVRKFTKQYEVDEKALKKVSGKKSRKQ